MTNSHRKSRPARLMGIAGTGTGVGKTWACAKLLAAARASGVKVAARKPVQSFEPGGGPTDAELLGAASGESPEVVCPRHRWYPVAMAAPMAADILCRPSLRLEEIVDEIAWPENTDLGLVETVGGLLSPLTHDAHSLDLLKRLEPDEVLLVADAGLGAINAVRLAMRLLAPFATTVLLNRFDPQNDLHRRNRDWLAMRDGLQVVTDAGSLI